MTRVSVSGKASAHEPHHLAQHAAACFPMPHPHPRFSLACIALVQQLPLTRLLLPMSLSRTQPPAQRSVVVRSACTAQRGTACWQTTAFRPIAAQKSIPWQTQQVQLPRGGHGAAAGRAAGRTGENNALVGQLDTAAQRGTAHRCPSSTARNQTRSTTPQQSATHRPGGIQQLFKECRLLLRQLDGVFDCGHLKHRPSAFAEHVGVLLLR